MKTVFLFFYLCIFFGSNHFLYAQEIVRGDQLYQEISVGTLYPYFEALQNGDVESLKRLLTGKIYEKYQVLLEKNDGYPEFLQNHFRDAEFFVGKIETNGNDVLVAVITQFPGNQAAESRFLLRREMDNSSSGLKRQGWKLVEQIQQ